MAVTHWPLRVRLTALSVAVMAVVLAGVGVGTVLHFRAAFDESVDTSLQARLHDLRAPGATVADVAGSAEGAEQILDRSGGVLAGSHVLGGRPLLDRTEMAAVDAGQVRTDHASAPGIAGPVRILAAATPGGQAVAVVAASLAGRDDAVADLRGELSFAFPLVLLAVAVGAYLVVGAALRPVERMRAHAEAISADHGDHQLPVPPTRDELARLGETLNAMLARLHAALERERRFVADASHELRTPLSLLTTELELAIRRPRGQVELEAALRSGLEETRRLTALAQDLMLLARAEQQPADTAALVPTRLAPVLFSAADHAQREPEGEITVDCPAELVARAEPDSLERAVRNLLDNARRHGRGPVSVQAQADPLDHAVAIRVRDHGAGFPAAFLPNAFERFTRADAARSGEGTGLGLAITAAIAHRMRGTVAAANHPDGGAIVTITLPDG